MAWPTPQDYNEAIQDPSSCFEDPLLRGGTIEQNQLGLPKPYSGGFATVYKVTAGDRVWAVRCFQRELADHQDRYGIIGEHLRSASLDAAVEFEFLPRGIRVMGKWYPVVRMEWVEGWLLHEYIMQNLAQPEVLLELCRRWIALMASLREAGIAHGDLQHGNIIVAGNRLRLIDYDGVFVPGLAGYPSLEDGHRNYQHPARCGFDFGPRLDNFSAWLIFLSIAALIVDPKLWYTLEAGDECLLFRRADFEQASQSKALHILRSAGKTELVSLAKDVYWLLLQKPAEIPYLDGVIQKPQMAPAAMPTAVQSLAMLHEPSWVDDHVAKCDAPATDEPAGEQSQTRANVDSIMQWLAKQEVQPAVFPSRPVLAGKVILTLGLMMAGICAIWGIANGTVMCLVYGTLSIGVLGACGWLLKLRYREMTVVSGKNHAIAQVAQLQADHQASQAEIITAENELRRVLGVAERIDAQLEELPDKMDQTLADLDARLKEELSQAALQRESLNKLRLQETQALDGRGATEIANLRQLLGQIAEREAMELRQLQTGGDTNPAQLRAVQSTYASQRAQVLDRIALIESQKPARRQALAGKFTPHFKRLDQLEQDAIQRHKIDTEMAQCDYITQRKELLGQARSVKERVNIRRNELDAHLERLRRTLLGIQLDLTRAQRTLEQYQGITFPTYVSLVVNGPK